MTESHPLKGGVARWRAYSELARFGKPAGTALLYFPCLYGTILMGILHDAEVPPLILAAANMKLLLGSFLVRSLGCTWNDIVDRDIDKKVKRTRLRPLPRGAIETYEAIGFAVAQLAFGSALTLALMPSPCFLWGVPSMLLTFLYPYSKTFTDYPQLILGLVFSWGVIISPIVLGLGTLWNMSKAHVAATVCLYASTVLWTVLYDTVYAAQDVADDVYLGVRSTMTRFRQAPRVFLRITGIFQCTLFAGVGVFTSAGNTFWIGSGLVAFSVGCMVETVDLSSPKDCAWWFKKGNLGIALVMGATLMDEYAQHIK